MRSVSNSMPTCMLDVPRNASRKSLKMREFGASPLFLLPAPCPQTGALTGLRYAPPGHLAHDELRLLACGGRQEGLVAL
jgi:hypothetical protein